MADTSKSNIPDSETIDPALAGIQPASMWRYFGDLARIPRESGNEAGVCEYVKALAARKGYVCEVNEVGDVLLRVNPGAPGPVVGLQAHMDMVCVSKDGTFDFAHEPIRLVREGDYIRADGTSLGADNGIGVAFALALAEELPGPIEVLLTVDEEKGFVGIDGVAPGWLHSTLLINIDSEEEGFFTIASAGASDFKLRFDANRMVHDQAFEAFEVSIDGLKGGHSGVEIHRGRTNALKVMGKVLSAAKAFGGVVYGMSGGTAPNVIPSACRGVVGVPPAVVDEFRTEIALLQTRLCTAEDPSLRIAVSQVPESRRPLADRTSETLIQLLDRLPTGVLVPSKLDPSQPFVSNNLAIAKELENGHFELTMMSRSPSSEELEKLGTLYKGIAKECGAEFEAGRLIPGWAPDYDSKLLARFQAKYREKYGKEGKVFEIHAGLECGALRTKYPGMDLISVGPDITGVHSPDEKVFIESTRRTYELVRDVIQDLHRQGG